MDRIGNGLQLGCEEERAISKRESQVSVMHIGMDSGTIHSSGREGLGANLESVTIFAVLLC